MRRAFRGLILVEALTTLVGGALAIAWPKAILDPFLAAPLTDPLTAPLGALAMWLGAAWIVLALMLLGSLRLGPGQVGPLRAIFAPLLLGDVLHVAGVVHLVETHGAWSAAGAAQVVWMLVLFAYRAYLFARPQTLLGPAP